MKGGGTATFEFTIGGVIGRTFSTLFKSPGVFLGIVLIPWLPYGLKSMTVGEDMLPRIISALLGLVATVLSLAAQGAAAYAALQVFKGHKVSLGQAMSKGRSCIVTVFAFGLLLNLMAIPAALLAGMLGRLGIVVFIFGGGAVLCAWTVVIPACAAEGLGAIDGMGRSAALTHGHRLKIFGICILAFVVSAIMGGIVTWFTSFIDDPSLVKLAANVTPFLLEVIFTIAIPIIYYNLRSTKDGVPVGALRKAFDQEGGRIS